MSSVRKRVLVTGGAGFLGSHLCERLVARGDDVLCVDNYFTGRKDNIAGLLGVPYFEAMRHDKKVVAGRLHFVLPTAVGATTIVDDVTEKEIHSALKRVGFKG